MGLVVYISTIHRCIKLFNYLFILIKNHSQKHIYDDIRERADYVDKVIDQISEINNDMIFSIDEVGFKISFE
ncbi:hypothetical protein H311_00917 [Anncaliia algerae PRA109]|nr:hypothetical protein H311_00917 [Anncaliia algerae PRA109]